MVSKTQFLRDFRRNKEIKEWSKLTVHKVSSQKWDRFQVGMLYKTARV